MEHILSSSKLFQSYSPIHQDKIRAAAQDPMNVELVKQLAAYLDKDYQKPEYINPKALQDKAPEPTASKDDTSPDAESEFNAGRPSGHPMSSPSSTPFTDAVIEDEADQGDMDLADDDNDTNVAEPPSEEISEATDVESDMTKDYQQLKSILQSSDSTAGVSRIATKGNEVWIYYIDRINLNNIMGNVVDTLAQHHYDELDFNRLARMDNAMVFVIHET